MDHIRPIIKSKHCKSNHRKSETVQKPRVTEVRWLAQDPRASQWRNRDRNPSLHTLNPKFFAQPHNPSWPLLLLPFCKPLHILHGPSQELLLGIFPDCLPGMPRPPVAVLSLLWAYTISISQVESHCNDLFILLSPQLDSKLFKVRCGSKHLPASLALVNGGGQGGVKALGSFSSVQPSHCSATWSSSQITLPLPKWGILTWACSGHTLVVLGSWPVCMREDLHWAVHGVKVKLCQ